MASVLITGASKGIGRAIATEAAARGHRVVATARDPRTLEDLDLDVDQRLALDVTDPESIAAAVAAAGEIDTLVSNAGVIFYAAVEATPPEELARLFDRNTLGALRVAQAVMPGMRERGHGRLLFMSSVVGRLVLPPNAAYASTKWALEALVEALAVETAPLGLETALLEPGAVSSGALDDVDWFRLPGDPYAHLGTGGIDGRTFVTPEEVAAAVVDAVETEHLPLRIPVGAPAKALLAARHDAPDDVPFVP
ncbi:SDR family NAD(P)-dependent oxidoreductase [Actinomycetospora sp.]|uniref:SDR family NAD(P)-dependent oxidoreductase n=1 Tax=Actinomycetospora sp. TaxID=1872135 RepID=UPI002F3ECB94